MTNVTVLLAVYCCKGYKNIPAAVMNQFILHSEGVGIRVSLCDNTQGRGYKQHTCHSVVKIAFPANITYE